MCQDLDPGILLLEGRLDGIKGIGQAGGAGHVEVGGTDTLGKTKTEHAGCQGKAAEFFETQHGHTPLWKAPERFRGTVEGRRLMNDGD